MQRNACQHHDGSSGLERHETLGHSLRDMLVRGILAWHG
jgi:hypothetical protein